jgi:hypothetical protein
MDHAFIRRSELALLFGSILGEARAEVAQKRRAAPNRPFDATILRHLSSAT